MKAIDAGIPSLLLLHGSEAARLPNLKTLSLERLSCVGRSRFALSRKGSTAWQSRLLRRFGTVSARRNQPMAIS